MTFRVGGYGFQGQLYEIIIYNTALTTTDRQSVEQYLAWKWGLASKLSTTHPAYKGPLVAFGRIPYYTAFSPLSIPTCALWLDAADSTTVTGTTTVTAWSDKSGNGRPVTITSAPSYGTTTQNKLKTLAFNNNQVTTSIASAVGTGDFTLIAVWYQSTGGTNTVLSLGTSGSSSQSLGYSATKYNFYQFGSAQESDYTTSAGSWVIQIGTRISSVKTVYINGYPGTTPSTDSYNQTVTTVTIGRGDSFGITGQIGEILVYTGTMTTVNRQLIESYLAQKWNLTAQLPLTHLNTTQPAGLPAAVPQVILLFTALSRFMSTYYNLSGAYALAGIANTVSLSSGTPAYVWTVAVPSNAKGKNGILAIFFNLYSTTAFLTNQSFDYGVYVDGVAQLLGDSSGTLRYVNTGATNYMMSSGGISLGLNGLVNGFPLIIPVSFAPSASQIQIGLKNSSAQMTGVASAAPSVGSNVVTSTGTLNTGNYVPQNTFTASGSNNYTVPTTVAAGTVNGVFIYCWGGTGASYAGNSGSAGFASAYYPCAGGTNLRYIVALNDSAGNPNTGGSGPGNGPGGGAFSGVFLSNAGGIAQSNVLVIAGGGGQSGGPQAGGGGGGGGVYASNASGTGYTGSAGYIYSSGFTSITGGTLSAGGSGTYPGGALVGGGNAGDAAAGGGGYFGGGGQSGFNTNQAGGGGSSFVANICSSAAFGQGLTAQIVSSNLMPPGGNTNPYYVLNSSYYGYGGSNIPNSSGYYGYGLVVIVPAVGTAATQIGVSAALYSG